MAFCANCGREISELAVACPHCGHPNQVRGASGTHGELQYAGWWVRFGTVLIDGLILGVGRALLGLPTGVVLWFVYTWLMLGLNDGRTLGCMALGVRVAGRVGDKISLGTAAARQGMAIVSGIPIALGYIWAAWDPEKRTWHDMVADTRAYRVR
jgi:uncharacterized RDD family membrane protein YckC